VSSAARTLPAVPPVQAHPADPAHPALPDDQAAGASRAAAVTTQLSSLSVSLMQDLTRTELGDTGERAMLEVLAASLRHGQAVSAQVRMGDERVVLTLFPREQLLHCRMSVEALLATDLMTWQVEAVLSPVVRAPVSLAAPGPAGVVPPFAPLAPLSWAVALAGSRAELLPELAGQAAYRVPPGADLDGLYMPGVMLACIQRLQRETCGVADIAQWHGIGRERAMRLLNALYLQSALIVSRSHPAATNTGWAGYT